MSTTSTTDTYADLEALCESVGSGTPVDAEVVRRVRHRADAVRADLGVGGPIDVAVNLIRETRDE